MTKLLKQPQNAKIVHSSNAKLTVERLGRFALIGVVSLGIGTAAVYDRYKNYWEKTIYRVQTVDFNMLSHTLPTKLSYTIVKNQPQELQRTLNSNYGLFGLIVTDPTGQNIIASSQGSSSKTAPDAQQLQKHPYDLLLDPPPIYPQWTYSEPHAVERSATNLTNRGRVIGRIYYVRGENPSFGDDVVKWLSKPLSPSSRAETFTITITTLLLSGLSFWLLWEHLLYKKRVQEARMREKEEELINRNKYLLLQLKERINEIANLKNLLELENIKFEEQTEQFVNRNQNLKQEINNLQDTIEKLKLTNNSVVNQDELEQAQKEIERAYRNQQEQNEKIKQLGDQLQDYYVQLEIAKRKGESLKQIEIQIQHITEDKLSAEKELNHIRERENKLNQTIDKLKNQLTSQAIAQNELNKQLQLLQDSLDESKNQEEESRNKALESAQQIEKLNQEMELLIEETGNRPLNAFEEKILNQIQNNLNTQEIHTLFDAGTGGERSKFIDLLIITNNAIFVIEAKAYRGEIKPIGIPRNSNWICRRGNNSTLVKSSWGYNPYQQVNTYTNAILGLLSNNWHPRKSVYGIIVFPSEARIDSEITSNMGKYYRATTLNNLITTIKELNH